MGWYSILPTHLTVYETWIIRAFLLLSVLNLLPWALAVLYDLLYYIVRQIWHEIPIWGGRARGQRRPRAPTLRGRDRRLSFIDIVGGNTGNAGNTTEGGNPEGQRQGDGAGGRRRWGPADEKGLGHRKTLSGQSIREEEEEDNDPDEGEEDKDLDLDERDYKDDD